MKGRGCLAAMLVAADLAGQPPAVTAVQGLARTS